MDGLIQPLALLVVGLPLAAALANALNLFGGGDRWFGWRVVQRLTVGAALLSFLGSLALAAMVFADPSPKRIVLYEWLAVGDLKVRVAFLIDTLSVLMMVMVTGFAFVIGKFSINYMHRERGFTRYFAAYALFIFAMLILVMGDNYVMLFVGWESVGVCSYLLIGQYNDRVSAARASTEAFVANRVGDAGFLVGIFMLLAEFGSVDYAEVAARLPGADEGTVTAIALCLLLGAVGKSAQLPLGSWLAKAMEGPTPSSALIHAATMVTAGVYLIVRSQDLYNAAPNALLVVALVGATTALYGALVGQTVSDIKGLLATSTTTQLGFMFLACGLGAYAVAVFHMLAHAFMKSYLFLTAPSILHHLHGKVDPARHEPPLELPTAYLLVTLVAGAMVAVPLLAGVLWPGSELPLDVAAGVLAAGGLMALVSAGYYGWSLTHQAFVAGDHGHGHGDADHHGDPASRGHLPAGPVAWPLALIVLAAAAGLALQLLPGGIEGSWFRALLGPIIRPLPEGVTGGAVGLRLALAVLLVAMVNYACLTALFLGRFRAETAVALARHRRAYTAALNRFWIDAFTRNVVVGSVRRLGAWLDRFDTRVVDRLVALPNALAERLGAAVAWLDEHAVGAGERAPHAIVRHFGVLVDSLDKHAVGNAESGVKAGAFALGRLGVAIERVIGGTESALRGLLFALARVSLGFERLIGGAESGLQSALSGTARQALGFERLIARVLASVSIVALALAGFFFAVG